MRTSSLRAGGRLRRTLAGAVTTALAASALVLAPTSAGAVTTGTAVGGAATWGTSTYLNAGSFGSPGPLASAYTAPASFDAETRLSTWGAAAGTIEDDGAATLSFSGTSVNFAPTSGSWLRFKDLQATIDADGNGSVTAEVSYGRSTTGDPGSLTYDPAQAPLRPAARVEIADLTGNSADDVAVTTTSATYTGLEATWADELTTYLAADPPAIPKFTYNAQVEGTPPLPFTFTVDRAAGTITSATVVEETPSSLRIAVTGTGYRPGGVGIYISLGESGSSDVTNPGSYVKTIWSANPATPGAAVQPDGTFSATLSLDATDIAKLDAAKSYSIITFKAHGQAVGDPSQTADRPVEIDFRTLGLKYAPAPVVTAATSTYGKAATVRVTVPTVKGVVPTGTVRLTGVGTAQTKTLSAGTTTFTLSKTLSPATRTAKAVYSGDSEYAATSGTTAHTVKKAAVTASTKVTKKPTRKKAGTARVTVKSKVSTLKPGGKVRLTFKKKGQKSVTTSTKTLRSGTATVTVPKLKKKGTWTVYVKYTAGSGYLSASSIKAGTVKVTK